MKLILSVLLVLFPIFSSTKTVRVGILDTGYDTTKIDFKQCDSGKSDVNFVKGSTIKDNHGHGNNILHIIADANKDVDYCIVMIKVWDPSDNGNHMDSYGLGLMYATKMKLDILNVSLTGNTSFPLETFAIKYMLDNGVKIVVAAGNDRKELTHSKCEAYPVCVDDRILSVGCLNGKEICTFSNYGGYIKVWEKGINITAGGITLSGTSQSAARVTSRKVRELSNKLK